MMWSWIYLLPKNLLSRICGQLVQIRWPYFLKTVERFAAHYKIDLDEAEHPISYYKTIQALFTRRLKSGLRPISNQEVVHPVDAELTVFTTVSEGKLLQVKGWDYSLKEFLNESDVQLFEGGKQLTYYLCPTDYHRVHSPVDGIITKINYIPGELWPVNNWSVTHIQNLFVRNERVVVWIQTSFGLVALVMVGATNVGKMTLAFDPTLITNVGQKAVIKNYSAPIPVCRGGEVGVFNMGSTVVMIYSASFPLPLVSDLPCKVKLGQGFKEP